MPRRKGRGKRRQKGQRGSVSRGPSLLPGLETKGEISNGAVRAKFVLHSRFVVSATVSAATINPLTTSLFGGECTAFAQLFQEFKLLDLRIKVMPFKTLASSSGNADTGVAVGWHPVVQGSGDSTIDNVVAATKSLYMNDSFTMPAEFHLTSRDFAKHNALKWYAVNNLASADDSTQGDLTYIAVGTNSATQVVTWIIESTWAFRGPVASGKFAMPVDPLKGLNPPPGREVKRQLDGSVDDNLAFEVIPSPPSGHTPELPDCKLCSSRPESLCVLARYRLVELRKLQNQGSTASQLVGAPRPSGVP